jgi:cyanophycinase
MNFKGKLIIIGGAEDKGDTLKEHEIKNADKDANETEILQRIVDESRDKEKSRFEIVTTASTIPETVGNDYIEAFEKLQVRNLGVLIIEDREKADDPDILQRLREADVVFVTGGDQLRLTSILGGTRFYDLLIEKLEDPKFLYAGTSAGAAAASENMIFQGKSTDALRKGEIRTTSGFGLVRNIVFDTHFIQRGRIGRLFQIIVSNPKILGVGLEENTGLLIQGSKMEAIGPGMTILVDGRGIRRSNYMVIKEGTPISIDNMTVHVMSKTDIYDLDEHTLTIVTPDECKL